MRFGPLPALLLFALSLPALAAAEPDTSELFFQLQQVERLIGEGDYVTALDDLRFVAQQVQEMRAAGAGALFPSPPEGWVVSDPVRTSREEDFWSRRLEVRRSYRPSSGSGKVDLLLDFESPLIPSASLAFNPLYVSSDPRRELLTLKGEEFLVTFNADTGEGEARVIVGARLLVTVNARGLEDRRRLMDFLESLDLAALRRARP